MLIAICLVVAGCGSGENATVQFCTTGDHAENKTIEVYYAIDNLPGRAKLTHYTNDGLCSDMIGYKLPVQGSKSEVMLNTHKHQGDTFKILINSKKGRWEITAGEKNITHFILANGVSVTPLTLF